MGFEFSTILAQACVVIILVVMVTSINFNELNSLIGGISIQAPNMVKLMVNALLLVFVSSIFLIPSLKGNVSKIINKPFEYSIKLLDKFMK
ncbi:MAG: hypothetical protein WC376_01850 [Candidatus Nanoarchaeia archaeon]